PAKYQSVLPWLRRAGGDVAGVRGVRAPRAHIGTPSPAKCLRLVGCAQRQRARLSRVQFASVLVHQRSTTTPSRPPGLFHATVCSPTAAAIGSLAPVSEGGNHDGIPSSGTPNSNRSGNSWVLSCPSRSCSSLIRH